MLQVLVIPWCGVLTMLRPSRFAWLAALVALAGWKVAPAVAEPVVQAFHRENVLGTSLDVTVVADDQPAAARACDAALAEIARLDQVLSTWRVDSEIRALPADTAVAPSADLLAVLQAAERARQATRGAFNPLVGRLVTTWRSAESAGQQPDPATLATLARAIQRPAFREVGRGRIVVHEPDLLAVDGVAKGYIIDRAATAATSVPGVRGVMVDIGGDLVVRGEAPPDNADGAWTVAVAEPADAAENAAPVLWLHLRDQAVATSGSYARPVKIGDQTFSHIIDPRSGRAVSPDRAATVVAPDAATADALATAFCVLDPAQAMAVVRSVNGAEAIVWAGGRTFSSDNWPPAPPGALAGGPSATPAVPASETSTGLPPVRIDMALSDDGRRSKKPYVVVWIASPQGQAVRTVEVWGQERKYQRDLRDWWRQAGSALRDVDAVSRASRRAGEYQLTWDLLDDAGQPVTPGRYIVHLEVAREDAGRWTASTPIVIGPQADQSQTQGSGDIVSLRASHDGVKP